MQHIEVEHASDLRYLIQSHREEIIADAYEALDRAHLAHYAAAGAEKCAECLSRLLDLVLESITEHSIVPVVQHAERVAWKRFEAGFDFREVHTAFNVLEEAIWKQVVAFTPAEQLAEALSLTGAVLGAGKEALAAEFVSLATKKQAYAVNLHHLFEGIEGVD